MNRHIQTTKRL